MIEFRQKEFKEYEAKTEFYVSLMRRQPNPRVWGGTITRSQLLPILKGNNIVIERFVSSTSFFSNAKYRMYLKIGAKAKMPDDVRLTEFVRNEKLFKAQINFNNNNGGGGGNQQKPKKKKKDNNQQRQKNNSEIEKSFTGISFDSIDVQYEVKELLGDAILYDKKSRELVLEFKDIDKALNALNILPFGLHYKYYLLDD